MPREKETYLTRRLLSLRPNTSLRELKHFLTSITDSLAKGTDNRATANNCVGKMGDDNQNHLRRVVTQSARF